MYGKMYTKIKEAIRAEAMSQIFFLPRSTFAFPSFLAGIKQGQNMQQVNLFGSRNIFVFIYFYYRFVSFWANNKLSAQQAEQAEQAQGVGAGGAGSREQPEQRQVQQRCRQTEESNRQ